MTGEDRTVQVPVSQPTPTAEPCGRRAWPHEEFQDEDDACVCLLAADHEGLHQCGAGCGVEFAGGVPAEPQVNVCLYCLGAGYHDGGDMRDDEPCNACGGTGIDPSTIRNVTPPAVTS